MKIQHIISDGGSHYYWQEAAEQMYEKGEHGEINPIEPSLGMLMNHVPIATIEEIEIESINDLDESE